MRVAYRRIPIDPRLSGGALFLRGSGANLHQRAPTI